MRDYDARLRVYPGVVPVVGQRLEGRIYDDHLSTGRHPFQDGRAVVTSPVVSFDGTVAGTRSGARYLLEGG